MAAKNPFPGMNPWLEARWGDVHASLVTYSRDHLQAALPGDLRARMQERVFIETFDDQRRSFNPDVHVVERRDRVPRAPTDQGRVAIATAATTAAEPLLIHVPQVEVTETYVEIIDVRSGGRVVTVIEFVSRSNKAAGPGRELYVQKQRDARRGHANLVEVDLLRGGRPVTLVPPHLIPAGARTPYHVCVHRATKPDRLEYYPAPLRQRLPAIGVPLRQSEPDVKIDLQTVLDLAYQRGGYDDIDYTEPLDPPLREEDELWARDLLTAAGLPAGRTPTDPTPSGPPA